LKIRAEIFLSGGASPYWDEIFASPPYPGIFEGSRVNCP